MTIEAILQKRDGYSKRIWLSEFKPMYFEMVYQPLGVLESPLDPSKLVTPKIAFRFKEWLTSTIALYEELS